MKLIEAKNYKFVYVAKIILFVNLNFREDIVENDNSLHSKAIGMNHNRFLEFAYIDLSDYLSNFVWNNKSKSLVSMIEESSSYINVKLF